MSGDYVLQVHENDLRDVIEQVLLDRAASDHDGLMLPQYEVAGISAEIVRRLSERVRR